MHVGIMTGGGDCSGLNAAIRGVAKSLIHRANAEIIGIEEGFLGLIEQRVRPISYDELSGIHDKGGTILGSTNRASPFNYNGKDVSADVATYYKELGLDAIIALGGDGSMTICYEMSKLGMNFVGIPKTIDNDLTGTDRTFGFSTAVDIATEAIDRLKTTAQSHRRVMILETMGRYAGWIALHAGVAGGADIILLPEFPYDIDEIVRAIEVREKNKSFSLIVIAEGAKPKDGQLNISKVMADSNSPEAIRLGGIGFYLQGQLEQRISSEVRTTTLGHVQRGGSPSAFDRVFATNLGSYAAELVISKRFGRMVTVTNNHLSSVPLEMVAHNVRNVTTNDMTLLSALALGVSIGDNTIALPENIADNQAIMG